MEMVPGRLLANASLVSAPQQAAQKAQHVTTALPHISEVERAPPGTAGGNHMGCLAESLSLHARSAFSVQALISVMATASHQFRPEEPSPPIS